MAAAAGQPCDAAWVARHKLCRRHVNTDPGVIGQITPGTVEEAKRKLLEGKEERVEEILRSKDVLRKLVGGWWLWLCGLDATRITMKTWHQTCPT
jgi:hypothetical protein